MGIISGSMLAIQAVRLLHDFTKDGSKNQPNGYVIVTSNSGRLRTRYRITCSKGHPDESTISRDRNTKDGGMEIVLVIEAKNPQLFAQRLLQRYAKNSNVGDWFSLNKKQLKDLEDIIVLIYTATG